jgi:hypothetical protein
VKCGRHFDAASASCPECGQVRGEPNALWPTPLLPGADRWRRPLAAAVQLAQTRAPEAIDHAALDEIFSDRQPVEIFSDRQPVEAISDRPSLAPLAAAADDSALDEITLLDDSEIFDVEDSEAAAPLQPEPPLAAPPAIAENADTERVLLAERFSWSDVAAPEEPADLATDLSAVIDAPVDHAAELAPAPVLEEQADDEDEAPPEAAALAGEIAHARLAPIWQRAIAALIDLLPIAGVTALTLIALEPVLEHAQAPLLPHSIDEFARFWWALGPKLIFVAVAVFGTALLYHVLSFIFMQGTVGDLAFGIVWITRRGRRPGVFRAIWRGVWLVVSVALFGGGFWFALLTRTKRPFYDVVSGLYPVKRKSCVVAEPVAELPLAA